MGLSQLQQIKNNNKKKRHEYKKNPIFFLFLNLSASLYKK